MYKRSYAEFYSCKRLANDCIEIAMKAYFLLLLLHELSVHGYFNTSLPFKWLSNEDLWVHVKEQLYSCITDFCLISIPVTSRSEGAEMFPTICERIFSFRMDCGGCVPTWPQPVHACKIRRFDFGRHLQEWRADIKSCFKSLRSKCSVYHATFCNGIKVKK